MRDGRLDWETPGDFFRQLDHEFRFTVDVCSTHENAKCARHFTVEDDGLLQDWAGEVCWMNPPYGKEIGAWMAKARAEAMRGATVVCLVPARTDTAWWHDSVEGKAEVRFVRGRLRFGDASNPPAPFPSAVVIYRPSKKARAA